MDKKKQEHELFQAAIAAAEGSGLEFAIKASEPRFDTERVDAVLDFRVDGRTTEYLVEVKKGLRPATLGAVLLQLKRLEDLGGRALLVADYVTPQLAQTLREQEIEFIDTAGNAYINQPPVLVWVKGQRPADNNIAGDAIGRAFKPSGLRVVFTLLCQPDCVNLPYREIAAMAGVAHGTVGWVMADLTDGDFIVTLGRKRRLRNRRRLLDIWVEAYARTLRHKLVLGRYRAHARDWWQDVDVRKYGLQFGGETAAELDAYLKPGVATLYGTQIPGRLIADHQLRIDNKGDVELRERFWNFDYDWNHPALVPPVLIYGDLLATGDARCVEAAERMYEAHLARLFE